MSSEQFTTLRGLLIAGVASLAGCAHVHVDAEGRQHIVGLVMITLPPSANSADRGADSVRVRSFGLSVLRSPVSSGVTIGFNDSTLVGIKNDSLISMQGVLTPDGQ